MAFFKKKPAPPEAAPLDWQLMQHGAVTLYHKGAILTDDLAWLQRAGYTVYSLDASRWQTAEAFHAEVKRVLAFPEWYTPNLASWLDCLSEINVPDTGGVVLAFKGYEVFARTQCELAQIVLDSIETASRRFLLTGRRLIALVQSGDPRIRFGRVGAVPVVWNAREWTDGQRGLGSAE